MTTNLNIDLLVTEICKKKIIFTIIKNQPQNRNFDRQLSKHSTVFEYAHDYLDNRLTKWLGAQNEKAPSCLHCLVFTGTKKVHGADTLIIELLRSAEGLKTLASLDEGKL